MASLPRSCSRHPERSANPRRPKKAVTVNLLSASRSTSAFTILPKLSLLVGCGGNSSPSYSASAQDGQIAAQEVIDQGDASVITIALVEADSIIWTRQFRLADREAGQPPADSTMFGIGSGGKMFAAIAVMNLFSSVDRLQPGATVDLARV